MQIDFTSGNAMVRNSLIISREFIFLVSILPLFLSIDIVVPSHFSN